MPNETGMRSESQFRSEAEIRRDVTIRLRRWTLLLLHAGMWAGVVKGLALFTSVRTDGWSQSVLFFLALWASLVGLHVLRTLYVEVREIAVRRAIEQERKRVDAYEKPKQRLELGADGELTEVEFEEPLYAQRISESQ